MRGWEHSLAGLPDEIQAILDQAKTGQVGIEFRVQDADQVVDSSVDSSVDGLITAATAIAGAELVSRRARPLVRNYSVPGLVAAGVAAAAWQRLIARRRARPSLLARARKALEVAHD
mgnify:FL=1